MAELKPARTSIPNEIGRLINPSGTNEYLENLAFLRLALSGDEYAKKDPRSLKSIKQASVPNKPSAGLIRLFQGGPSSSSFWTTNPSRAASYGNVRFVDVPKSVVEAGKVQARKLGEPTRWDTVLDANWAGKAKDAPWVKAEAVEITPASEDLTEAFLKTLGVKRY